MCQGTYSSGVIHGAVSSCEAKGQGSSKTVIAQVGWTGVTGEQSMACHGMPWHAMACLLNPLID